MADEFQGGVCGGNWWSTYSRKNMFGSSLCSSGGINDIGGGFGWSGDLFDMKIRSTDESALASSNGSLLLQDGSLFPNNGRSESNYSSCMQQEVLNSGMNYGQESGGMNCHQIQKEWSPKGFTNEIISDDSSTNTFKPVDQNFMNSITTAASTGLSTSFSMNSSSSYAYPSNLMQTQFDTNTQKPIFDNQSMNFPMSTNYFPSLGDFSPSLPKFSPSMLKAASLQKQQEVINELAPFSGGSTLWNASAATLSDLRATLLPSTRLGTPSSISEKMNFRNLTAKRNNEELSKKTNDETTFKRPRIETPSPLPTFKVRKEKLGDRITALQQLVSPFGKTDTASVLHEAIDYIKFLHNQVSALSTPYQKNGAPGQRQQTGDKIQKKEGLKQDLKSRGLCLVPISSTFPVAGETTADFWTPSFGGAFR